MNKVNFGLLTALAIILAATSVTKAEILIGVPLTDDPSASEYDKQIQRSAELAVADLNAKGGLLGEELRLVFDVDDCKSDPAVQVAEQFVDQGVSFVVGHICSGSAIAAATVYEQAEVLMISASATNPKLTDEGGGNVFRVCGRDDEQGPMAASYLDEQWSDKKIAILHDGEAFGEGLAELVKAYLNRMGRQEVMFEAYTPGQDDYSELVADMQAAGVEVVYIGGYESEIGLIIRQAREQGSELQLVGADSLAVPKFGEIAGKTAEGTLFTAPRDPRREPAAAEVMAALRAQGLDDPLSAALYSHAVFEIWAEAVEKAGTFDLDAVTKVLHDQEFDTAIGKVAFDQKGDVTESGFEWFVWTSDGPLPKGES